MGRRCIHFGFSEVPSLSVIQSCVGHLCVRFSESNACFSVLPLGRTRSGINQLQKHVPKITDKKNSEDGITAEMLEVMPAEQTEALAENLNERCSNFHFDEGLTKAAAALISKKTGAQRLDGFRPIACLTTMRKKLGGVSLVNDLWEGSDANPSRQPS